VLLTALLILPLVARIRAEEGLLRSQFGGEYDEMHVTVDAGIEAKSGRTLFALDEGWSRTKPLWCCTV
jgi:hypothetical protein